MRPALRVALPLLLCACASTEPAPPIQVNAVEATREDFLDRLQEAGARVDTDDANAVLNSLEHLMPS